MNQEALALIFTPRGLSGTMTSSRETELLSLSVHSEGNALGLIGYDCFSVCAPAEAIPETVMLRVRRRRVLDRISVDLIAGLRIATPPLPVKGSDQTSED